METLVENLRNALLPESFEIAFNRLSFDTGKEFLEAAEDDILFRALGDTVTGIQCADVYVDRFESGFLGAYALALWFMEFDQDNWFSFEDIHAWTETLLNSRPKLKDRTELRLLKGEFPPMMLDQPVIVDYREQTITFLTGKLNG